MMTAPKPGNERERLRALRRYDILDTLPEATYERITRLAARMLKVPVALITLVDEERQWFKSAYGLKISETGRDVSFCAHAILGGDDDVMVVSDATADPRFAGNPFVTGEPGIRFYAGAPLKSSDDFSLGTLCVVDTVPRQFGAEEQAILRDLAAVVRNEIEMRLKLRERDQLAAAVDNLSSGVVITDPNQPDNPITFASPGFYKVTGYGPEEIIGYNCRFLQGAETDRSVVAEMRECFAQRRTFQGVLLNYRKDGSPFWNELTIAPVFDQDGRLINFAGLQIDVTERKRAADQIQRSFEELKRLEALRDDLTHMVVHDLRSPLNGVKGFLDLLALSAVAKLGPKEVGYIEHARNGAARLADMVTSLLDVHRLESGEMPLRQEKRDLVEIVRQAAEPYLAGGGDGRQFSLDLPPAPVPVSCDADLIGRVVTNLVSNALKFTPREGRVQVRVAPNGTMAYVAVSDSGAGIPVEYHDKIFEKFGQVECHRERHSTGLGLTFCKLAVEAHGGTIALASEAGKGSTFEFGLAKA